MAFKAALFATNFPYRMVRLEDLKEGVRLLMVYLRPGYIPPASTDPQFYGTWIEVDPRGVQNGVVYYHCIYPSWAGQCFVPVEEFIDPPRDSTAVYLVSERDIPEHIQRIPIQAVA